MKKWLFFSLFLTFSLPTLAMNLVLQKEGVSQKITLQKEQKINLEKGEYRLIFDENCQTLPKAQKMPYNKPLAIHCDQRHFQLKVFFQGDYLLTFQDHHFSITKATKAVEVKLEVPKVATPKHQLDEQGFATIDIGESFPQGTKLKELFSEQIVEVKNQQIRFKPNKNTGGLSLFEEVGAKFVPNKRAEIIYFVLVDRFFNGDPTNDNAYGSQKEGKDEVGTFHGGDLKGLTSKLDYIASLGTTTLWISPIVEQIHGAISGNNGAFPFYAYHGYWAKDFTKMDAHFGEKADLQALVEKAHALGMKVMLDVVLNHAGYPTVQDMQEMQIDVVDNQQLNIASPHWQNWWGREWVRGDFPNYQKSGTSNETMNLSGLPDFITENPNPVTPPQWLLANPHTRVKTMPHFTVKDYLIQWQSDWVGEFGIDAFRLDTVQHITADVWQGLKQQAQQKLNQWRQQKGLKPQDFYLLGEVWGHGIDGGYYQKTGFDSLINFDFQQQALRGALSLAQMDHLYQRYAKSVAQNPTFTPLSYLSSHDTELFFNRYRSIDLQQKAANVLMLLPGNIQLYYGDEVAREFGKTGGDTHQGTRSDMIFDLDKDRQKLLQHWQKLGQFRQKHSEIALGEHKVLIQKNGEYVFTRTLDKQKILAIFAEVE